MRDSIDASDVSQPPSPRQRVRSIPTTSAASSEVSPPMNPQPGTPTIQPALSLSSSIASLDPLSRSVPPSPAITALTERLSAGHMESGQPGVKIVHELAVARGERAAGPEDDEWEEVEVGKGLAHYNSVEIDRIKGLKR